MKKSLPLLAATLLLSTSALAKGPLGKLPKMPMMARFDDVIAPSLLTKNYIQPKNAVGVFNQWNENNGYCGEVNVMQAAMNSGQWMSQYNARLICGAGLSQSGPDGFCAAHNGTSNYNAQVLFENPNPGDQSFANVGQCLKNAKLSYSLYDYTKASAGREGYKQYMSWVKSELIAGKQVAVAVLNNGGSDPQYDHEVSVSKIGTNHAANDSTYYDDDVLYFDDHGTGGRAYTAGYSFASLAKSRSGANGLGANTYSILIPGSFPTFSSTGGDGLSNNTHAIKASNYAFSVSGVADRDAVTLPVRLTLIGSSLNGVKNSPMTSTVGYNFEHPEVPSECTNETPSTWMGIELQAVANELLPGVTYRLYEYDFDRLQNLVGDAAAINVPTADFNSQAALANHVTEFVATASSYTQTVERSSDQVIAFRCVRSDAP